MSTTQSARPALIILCIGLLVAATVLGDDEDPQESLTIRTPEGDEQVIQISRDLLIQALEEWEPPLVLRSYNVAALLKEKPAYLFAFLEDPTRYPYNDRYCGGGGGGIFDDDDDDCEAGLSEMLVDFIQRFVDPQNDTWECNGGRCGIEIDKKNGRMLVKCTPQAHKQIQELLDKHLAPKTTNLTVQVAAVEFSDEFARKLIMGGLPVARTDKEREQLNGAIVKVHGCTSLSGTDGQQLSTHSGISVGFMGGAEPVVAEQAVSYDPTLDYIFEGLTVRSTATLFPGGKAEGQETKALLDYRLRYMSPMRFEQFGVESAVPNQKAAATIQTPTVARDEHSGTVTVELDCPTIVTGGLVPAILVYSGDEAGPRGRKIPLYYIMTVQQLGGDQKKDTAK